jgi:hypothetical protein
MADFIIPLISTGTGVGVSTLKMTVNSNTSMSIDGNGMFYDDSGGTINGGKSRAITTGGVRTFYLKVTSGTCNITILDGGDKVTRFDEWTSSTNAASIYLMNLSSLPAVLTYFSCTGSNTITGNLSSLPAVLTYFVCTGSNTITGNLSSLPAVLTYFYCTGSNTITGNLSSLPAVLTYFVCTGSNTITGNLSSLPAVLTYFICSGSNTITGNLSSLPAVLTYFSCSGSNTITGNLSSLPAVLTDFYCTGSNTITGNLSSLPAVLTYFYCTGLSQINAYTAGKDFANSMNRFVLTPFLKGAATFDLSNCTGLSGDCGGNSGIIFTSAVPQFYKHTSGACTWNDATKWFSDADKTIAGRVPLPQDDATFDATSFTGISTITVDCPRIGRSLNMEGVNQAVTFSLANNIECYGSYVLGQNITPSGNFIINLVGRGNYNLNLYNKSIYAVTINCTSTNTYLSQSSITTTAVASVIGQGTLLVLSGIFNLNGNNYTGEFLQNNASFISGNAVITCTRLSGNTIYLAGTNNLIGSTLIFSPASGSGNCTINCQVSVIYNIVEFAGTHTGNFDITGNNTFAELIIDDGRKVRFTAGTTQTIAKITRGTGTSQITIDSVTAATHTINYTGAVTNLDYLNIKNSIVTQANKLFTGFNSVDSGGNSGWVFGRAEVIGNIPFTEYEVIESTLLGQTLIAANFTESEIAYFGEIVKGICISTNFTEGEEAATELLAKAFIEANFTEAETMDVELLAKAFVEAAFTEGEEAATELLAKAFIEANFTESEIADFGEIVKGICISVNFTEGEELALMVFEKITGQLQFADITITGQMVFTEKITGQLKFL